MNDDQKGPVAVPETTYLPPQQPGAETSGGEQPPETRAKSAESTIRTTPAQPPPPVTPLDDSQVATLDLPPSGAPVGDDSVTLPTIDQTSAGQVAAIARPATPAIGRQIGDYDVLGELGRGGMGVVYQARHRQLGRVVALKMIRAGAHADADDLSRFLSEAQAVARLAHVGIVQIFDIGQHDGLPYFSLEFVAGQSLLARIAKEPLEPRQAAQLVEKLARAMQYAHDQGILHRDLKPANVLLTPDDEPKITDFGLAKHIQEGASASTQTGSIMGTPSYMSPEQASGMNKELTPATDQYALGAVLYHLLTGRPPFLAAKAVETVLQVLHNDPVPPRHLAPKLPVDLETICLKAIQKDPQRRYASCDELAADLRCFLDGEPILARPVSSPERLWRWCRRNPRIAVPTAASILLFLIAFGIAVASAWSLSSLNASLKVQTKAAQTQEGIAKQNANEATEAQRQEKIARQQADQRTDLALTTIKRVFTKVQTGVGKTPGLQPFKKDLIETAARDLEKVEGLTGASGITAAATTLAYHELMAQLYREEGETEKAWSHLQEAHAIARQRIKDQSGSTASRINLAAICRDMAQIRQEYQRDMEVSLKFSQEAASLYEDVLANPKPQPGDPPRLQVTMWLSEAYSAIGAMYVRLGDPFKALLHFEKTQQVRDDILKDAEYLQLPEKARQANEAAFRELSAVSYLAIGDMHFRLDRPQQAKESYARALAIREEVYQKYGTNPLAKQQFAAYSSQAGYLHFVLGAPDKAAPLYEQAVKLAAELAAADSKIVEYQRILALAHYRYGILKQSQGDATAKENFDACLKIRTELARDAANVSRQRELLVILARSGQHQQAAELAGKLLASGMPDIELLLDAARAYAQCGTAVANDATAADGYTVKAIDAISQSVKAGHKDPVYLATEPDFVPLRGRDDFQALLAQERQAAAAAPKN